MRKMKFRNPSFLLKERAPVLKRENLDEEKEISKSKLSLEIEGFLANGKTWMRKFVFRLLMARDFLIQGLK
jgi:hypothetical protein